MLPMHPYFYAFGVGILTDSVFMAFALADRINMIRKDREEAQANLLLQVQETQRQQQRVLHLRDEIARDMHDDMGSNLSSISMLSEALKPGLPAAKQEQIGLIGERAREALLTMSDLIWSADPGKDRLEELLSRMREYALEVLEPQGVSVQFEFPGVNGELVLPMKKRKDLYLIFKEAVNNCAKYAGATTVLIRMAYDSEDLEFSIRDDGKGFDPDRIQTPNKGNGLRNMKKRAAELGGSLWINSSSGTGTEIRLRFPVT